MSGEARDHAIMSAKVEGRKAAEAHAHHSTNPYPSRDYELHLAWSNAWLVRTVEIEDDCKLQVRDGSVAAEAKEISKEDL